MGRWRKPLGGLCLFAAGLAEGLAAGLVARVGTVRAAAPEPTLTVRLHRFQLRQDQLPEFDRWVAFEHAHHAETLLTLDREHMDAEALFRDAAHDPTTLYWLEIRDSGGAAVESSPLPIDKVYEEFMHRTLVPGPHTVMQPEYTLIPPFLMRSIEAHRAAALR